MRAPFPCTCATTGDGGPSQKAFARSARARVVAQLADRIAFLTTRYGSDPAAWQHEIAALAAMEQADPKAAIERFHHLKRRLVEFRRAQLFRELRAFAFVTDVPGTDTKGYPVKELEADVREATRALALAKRIAGAWREAQEAVASLRHRPAPSTSAAAVAASRWDALALLADAAEAARRAAMREARLERRYAAAARRVGRLELRPVVLPRSSLDAEAFDAALDETERALDAAEALDEAYRASVAPLKAPEVATFRHDTKRKLEREARSLGEAGDVAGLQRVAARAEALRVECAKLASEAARSRRAGRAGPERERRGSDTMDGYG